MWVFQRKRRRGKIWIPHHIISGDIYVMSHRWHHLRVLLEETVSEFFFASPFSVPQIIRMCIEHYGFGNMDLFSLGDDNPISLSIREWRNQPLQIPREIFFMNLLPACLHYQINNCGIDSFTIVWHEAGIKLQNGCPSGTLTNVVN